MKEVAKQLLRLAKDILSERNYDGVMDDIRDALSDHDYDEQSLGEIDKGDIKIFVPNKPGKRKSVLVTAGFHGEEPAGPLGVISFIERYPELIDDVAVSLIPIVNIHGYIKGVREGETGTSTNWMMTNDDEFREKLGKEALILKKQFPLLGKLAKDGLFDAHEDYSSSGFYVYVLGNPKSGIVKDIKKVGLKHFEFKRDGTYTDNGSYELKDGLVDNLKDGSFEYALYKQYKIPVAIATETPMRDAEIEQRAEACGDFIAAFVKGVRDGKI